MKLSVSVNGSANISALGVTENYPPGWNVSNISYTGIKNDNRIEWLFWSEGNWVQDHNITYDITVPPLADGIYYFDGTADYGEQTIPQTQGDAQVTVEACALKGNYKPCGVVTLGEVVAYVNLWADGQAALGDAIRLVNAWADPVGHPPN